MNILLEKIDEQTRAIVNACFPDYTGKKISVSDNIPTDIHSYWDGGSRNFYAFYHLDEKKVVSVHSNHPIFEPDRPNYLAKLPDRMILGELRCFCGKWSGVTLYANKSDLTFMLTEPAAELDIAEKIVLVATRSMKATYNGQSRFDRAQDETSIQKYEWDEAVERLIESGHLRKHNKSITPKGINATDGIFSLREVMDR